MELAIMNRSGSDMQTYPVDLVDVRTRYEEILAAQEEVGGELVVRAKVAAGGAKRFDLLICGEDTDASASSVVGVVFHHHLCNAYFSEDGEKKSPPLCSSLDGVTGTVRESGEVRSCAECPYNEYGSSAKGRGKACKNMIRLYLLTEGIPAPLVISLPPTSIEKWRNYRLSLLAVNHLKVDEVVTELTILKAENAKGDAYGVVKPKMLGRITDEMREVVDFFKAGMRAEIELSADDYNRGDGEDSHA